MNPKAIYILSAAIRTGKTTSLQNWVSGRKKISGLLTPVIGGKRKFLEIANGDIFDMEAGDDDADVLLVGRFRFSRSSFDKAVDMLRQSPIAGGWRVIDEIGPLELRGDGFGPVLKALLRDYAAHEERLLLVVRDSLLDEVRMHFQLDEFEIVLLGKNELHRLI